MATPSSRLLLQHDDTGPRLTLGPSVSETVVPLSPITAEVAARAQAADPAPRHERVGCPADRASRRVGASPRGADRDPDLRPGCRPGGRSGPRPACGPRATVIVPLAPAGGLRVRGEERGRHRHRAEQTPRPAAGRPAACAQAAPRARRWAMPASAAMRRHGRPASHIPGESRAPIGHPARRGTPLARRPPVPPGVLRQAGIRECRTPSRRSAAATAPAPARQAPRPTSTMVDQDVPSSAGAGRAGTDTRVVVVAGP